MLIQLRRIQSTNDAQCRQNNFDLSSIFHRPRFFRREDLRYDTLITRTTYHLRSRTQLFFVHYSEVYDHITKDTLVEVAEECRRIHIVTSICTNDRELITISVSLIICTINDVNHRLIQLQIIVLLFCINRVYLTVCLRINQRRSILIITNGNIDYSTRYIIDTITLLNITQCSILQRIRSLCVIDCSNSCKNTALDLLAYTREGLIGSLVTIEIQQNFIVIDRNRDCETTERVHLLLCTIHQCNTILKNGRRDHIDSIEILTNTVVTVLIIRLALRQIISSLYNITDLIRVILRVLIASCKSL